MFAVIFEVEPMPERREEYLQLAAFLKPSLEKIDGFLDVERFANMANNGRVLSLSLWRDEKSVIRWRTLRVHHEVQAKGRSDIFRDYHLRVGEVTADTSWSGGEAPPQRRFDETETGTAKAVTISEFTPGSGRHSAGNIDAAQTLPAPGSLGLVDRESFESIYNPGKTLVLASWLHESAARAWQPGSVAGTEIRHRHVRIIRDYGMFDRREAPQYYPAARPAT